VVVFSSALLHRSNHINYATPFSSVVFNVVQSQFAMLKHGLVVIPL